MARAWFAVTAAVVLLGLMIQVLVTGALDQGHFTSVGSRVANLLFFFTIESNLIVGVTCLLLALRPDRSSLAFWVLRLTGVVAITIVGVVYHALLAGLYELTLWGTVADVLLHTVVPVLAVVGWLVFGPRGRTSARVAALALIFPVGWLVMTLIRGPIVDWYPYPFIDVTAHGYPRVLLNALGIAALFLLVAGSATALDRWLDRWLARRRAVLAPGGGG
jgi:hypothetical protein